MIFKNLRVKLLFAGLEKTKFGSIRLKALDSEQEWHFGEGPQICEIDVASTGILAEIISGGDLALAEAVTNGTISFSDETAFVHWACLNDEALRKSFHGTLLGTIGPRLKQLLRGNTVSGAKRNIMAHYDLGNEFYKQWLDPSMSYSSALFETKDYREELLDAQMKKYDRIIDNLNIKQGDHVLEVGCGWGGFFTRAIERTGCKVTAVMNSPAQAAYNRQLIKHKGLEKHINLALIDYRQIEGAFDKVVSIEMIEAVGQKYWSTYFNKISESLKPGGQAMIQAITIRENRFADYSRNPDFINTMIFPGGMLLTNQAIAANARSFGMASATPFEFGHSYAETLCRWKAHFLDATENGALGTLDSRFRNLWRFYLSYCEGAFKAERINVGHFLLEKHV